MPLYGQLDPRRGLVIREKSKQPETAGPDAEVAVLTWENIVHLVAKAGKVRESIDNLHLVASCIANKPIGQAPVGVEMHLVPVDRAMPKKEKEEDGEPEWNGSSFAVTCLLGMSIGVVKLTSVVNSTERGPTVRWKSLVAGETGSMSLAEWNRSAAEYDAIAAHATATLKSNMEPTIKAQARQAGRVAILEDVLREIGKIADKCSTGPVPPDGYWNIYEWVSENVSL